jgi:alpha-beta hydrolase superfamily lysophospholipase
MPALFLTLLLIYAAVCLLFYLLQGYFFFRPEILPQQFEYSYPFPFEELNFEMADGARINGIHFKVPNAKGIVFYLKGNSRSIKGWGKFARDFVSKGYDFFMFDYRGFGKSKGRRSESALYHDAQTVYTWLRSVFPEGEIVIYGRSLGSGIAARIAAWNNPKMLILDSPYYSFLYQIRRYGFFLPLRLLLRYQMRTDLFVQQIRCPIFILHGVKDRLISYRQSLMLRALKPAQIVLLSISQGRHNNLPDLAAYHDYLYDILNEPGFFAYHLEKQASVKP